MVKKTINKIKQQQINLNLIIVFLFSFYHDLEVFYSGSDPCKDLGVREVNDRKDFLCSGIVLHSFIVPTKPYTHISTA